MVSLDLPLLAKVFLPFLLLRSNKKRGRKLNLISWNLFFMKEEDKTKLLSNTSYSEKPNKGNIKVLQFILVDVAR